MLSIIFKNLKSTCITPTSREDVIYVFLTYLFMLFHHVSGFLFFRFWGESCFFGFCEVMFLCVRALDIVFAKSFVEII